MFAQPINSGIAVAIAQDLLVPDPEKSTAMEILNGNTRTIRNNRENSDESVS